MAGDRLTWCYIVAGRMWHGQYFAAGGWARVVNFSTVLFGPIGAILVWKRRELLGTGILLFLAIGWLSLNVDLLWDPSLLFLVPEASMYLALSLLTLLVVGAHALVRAMTR
jgi:hypothetical protein